MEKQKYPSAPKERTWPPIGRSQWLTVAIRDVTRWPNFEYFQNYDGFEFILLPETTTSPPAISIELRAGLDMQKARAAIRRFLSAYAWAERHSIDDDFGIGMSRPGGVGKHESPILTRSDGFHLDYLPSTSDPKTQLCLALYREALCLRNEAYRFLAFFKIINVLHKDGPAQKAWINGVIPKLTNSRSMTVIAKLQQTEANLGKYLFESGRCAVAHAFAEPIANPDDPADTERLSNELPIIQDLAEYLIEHELGIKSADAVWKEHLYELKGFREFFGERIVSLLKGKAEMKPEDFPPLPTLSFHVRDHLPRPTFVSMSSSITSADNGRVMITCKSAPTQLASIRLTLDFPAERLKIDPNNDISSNDDGSAQAMIAAMDARLIHKLIFSNRIIEVWTADDKQPWGRTDPYIPTNMRFDFKAWTKTQEDLFKKFLLRDGSEHLAKKWQRSSPATGD